MKPVGTFVVLSAVLLAAAGSVVAADLEELVKKSDLVVVGQVFNIAQGKLDRELLKIGVEFRTDVADLVVLEALKGDPDLKKVRVGFPAFPKAGQVKLKLRQDGIWLLTKSDRKFYVLKGPDRLLPQDKLGAVRRAVRAAAGVATARQKPADRAAQAARLRKDLDNGEPAARRLAAYRLGELGATAAVPALIRALDDAEPPVRLAADIALRKITGHRAQVDFENETDDARSRGIKAWQEWWLANKGEERKQILLAAVRASSRPQPNFRRAVEGLADYHDPDLLPVFLRVLNSAVSSKDNTLTATVARYLGRVRHRASVPRLVQMIDGTLGWTNTSTRTAAAAAIGNIVGEDFGTGSAAVRKCLEWWRAHANEFD